MTLFVAVYLRASILCCFLLFSACGLVESAFAAAGEGAASLASPKAPAVRISPDGRSLIVTPTEGAAPVNVPVLDRCRDPAVGEPRIRHVSVEQGIAKLIYGKHCAADLSLEAMELRCTGCD